MFNFRKNKEEKDIKEEERKEVVRELQEPVDVTGLAEQLEYMNSYLAQANIINGELLKQVTISNALRMLDHQYTHADGFMQVNEIKEKYRALAAEIFADYHEELEKEKQDK